MVTGFDILPHNKPLQKHWVKRTAAYIIDLIITSLIVWIFFVSLFFGLGPYTFWYFPVVAGAIQVFYSAVLEYMKRQTIGKMIMDVKVESLKSDMEFSEAIIRNLSKVQGLLVFLDTIVGLATRGDPRQRYLDRVANTTVTSTHHESHELHLEEMISQHMPHIMSHPNQEQQTPPPPQSNQQPEEKICPNCASTMTDQGNGRFVCTNCGNVVEEDQDGWRSN